LSRAEIDGLVYSYLKSRGYTHALRAMQSETSADLRLTDEQILAANAISVITDREKQMLHSIYDYVHSDDSIQWFNDSYRYLYLWINQCLDCYRIELQPITYPIFVHFIFDLLLKSDVENALNFYNEYHGEHNLLHSQDVAQMYELIETVDIGKRNGRGKGKGNGNRNGNGNGNEEKDAEQKKEWEARARVQIQTYPIYNRYRKHKYQVSMSVVSHNLLMSWLNSSKFNLLIKTINDHIDFRIVSHEPSSTRNVARPPLGIDDDELAAMNKSKIAWGISRYLDAVERKAFTERNRGKMSSSSTSKGGLERMEIADTHPSQPKLNKEDEKVLLQSIKDRVYCGPDRLPSICQYKFVNAGDGVSCSNVSSNAEWIVVGCNDSTIRLYDVRVATGKSANSQRDGVEDADHKMDVDSNPAVQRSEENEYAQSAEFGTLHCHKLIGHKSTVTSISMYPDNEFFISSSADNTVRLWSTALSKMDGGQSCLAWYRGHSFPIWSCCFSPLGLYFATASHDRTARLWSTDKGVPIRIFAGHLSDVECVRFHPNCNYVATGSSDRTIRLWDIQSGNCVRLMTGHLSAVNDVQFTSDGRCIVSASQDRTIRVWDIQSGECISSLSGHTDDVKHITLGHGVNTNAVCIEEGTSSNPNANSNRNGNGGDSGPKISSFPLVISSGMDNTVRFWNVNEAEKPLVKTINTNMCVSHLEMTKSNLLLLSGAVL